MQRASFRFEVVHAIKTFSIRTIILRLEVHKTLAKLKCKRGDRVCMEFESCITKDDELWEIKKYKGSYTCMNHL